MPGRPLSAPHEPRRLLFRRASALAVCAALALTGALVGCGEGEDGGSAVAETVATAVTGDTTSGPAYSVPDSVLVASYDPASAVVQNNATIDTSRTGEGVVFATVTSSVRCKFQVASGDQSYNYDLPQDGTPICVPLNLGSGDYVFRVMQNTEGSNYVELMRVEQSVELTDALLPYLQPGVFCDYDADSACVAKAKELAAGAENEGDALAAVVTWVVDNVTYDEGKAAELASATGYVPDPDETLASRTGICFDYASLSAAMLRSLGIPCQLVTGYVDPGDLYHAWNMVYIDGTWHSVHFTVEADTWTRVDTTFAASGALSTVGSGTGYEDRYVY